MSAGLPQKYEDAKVKDVQSLFVFPTEGESTRTEYRLCGSFAFIDYNIRIGAVSMALIPCYIFLQFCTTIK